MYSSQKKQSGKLTILAESIIFSRFVLLISLITISGALLSCKKAISPLANCSEESDPISPNKSTNPPLNELSSSESAQTRLSRISPQGDERIPHQARMEQDLFNPQKEGWHAEALSKAASSRLKILADLVTQQDKQSTKDIAQLDLLTESFLCDSLIPEKTQPVFHSKQLSVSRGRGIAPSTTNLTGANALAKEIHELRKRMVGGSDLRFEFKIHDTQITDKRRFKTGVYTHLSGRLTNGMIEENSSWTIDWEIVSPDTHPRIRKIRVHSFEEVKSNISHGKPLFAECTGAVFQKVESYREQLAYSNSYWRKRIENFHVIYKPAQNGLAVGDANGDGLDDVYICQPGGLPNRLYLHQKDNTVRDESASTGVDLLDNTRSALFIDFDNDGDQDLVLAISSGLLFMNNDGRGHFSPIKVIPAIADAYSLAATDYDNDGDLDIYATRYFRADANVESLPIPVPYFDAHNGGKNYLVRNDGNWRTSDATADAGLAAGNDRFSYAAIWIDYDNDGDQDLYVANDFGRNNLYQNNVNMNSKVSFKEVASQIGLHDGAFGMSASAGDYDRDGFDDIYVGNMFSAAGSRVTRQPMFKSNASSELRSQYQHLARGNTLLRNVSGKKFQDVAVEAGVTLGRWSWGSLFCDINNDGWDDLLVSNGYITGDDPENDL